MRLVEGRSCGECTVCCSVAPVVSSVLTKPPNSLCPNCIVGSGCSIYDQRPSACRESYCGWRAYAELGDEWRPDRSDVLILVETDVPAELGATTGLKFLLVGGDQPLSTAPFLGYVSALVRRNVPVSLSVQGPRGHWPVKVFLNKALALPVRRFDIGGVRTVLLAKARMLREGAFEQADMVNAE